MTAVNFPLVRLLFALTLVLAAGAAAADGGKQEARLWLEKSAKALHSLNYQGTFVYLHDNQLHAMRVVHSTDETGEHERLVSLTGFSREVIRDNNLVTCILPDSESVVVERSRPERSFPLLLPRDVDRLAQHYTFSMSEQERVAGRQAQKIIIQPRDNYRYGYELWMDQESHLLLRAQLMNEEGIPVEQFMFTSIELLDEVPAELLRPSVSGEEFTWYHRKDEARPRAASASQWDVRNLPAGFRLELHRQNYLSTSFSPVEHLVFSDGLSSVSVFIEELNEGQPPLIGSSKMGAVNAYGGVAQGHQITVVGEVPPDTVKLIGESVAYRDHSRK